jgi:hypothetical protein
MYNNHIKRLTYVTMKTLELSKNLKVHTKHQIHTLMLLTVLLEISCSLATRAASCAFISSSLS